MSADELAQATFKLDKLEVKIFGEIVYREAEDDENENAES